MSDRVIGGEPEPAPFEVPHRVGVLELLERSTARVEAATHPPILLLGYLELPTRPSG